MSRKQIIQKVRKGGSINGKITNLVVTVPINSGIQVGDHVKIEMVE